MSTAERVAGLLLHPTSLPGPWGAGDLGPSAEALLEWAAAAGFGLWQVLPLGPSAAGDSPYSALSAFALDPFLISLERLSQDGLLDPEHMPEPLAEGSRCDFKSMRQLKAPLLHRAWHRFQHRPGSELENAYAAFRDEPLHRAWLEDWCLFAALRRRHDGAGWWTWEPPLRDRQPEALETARRDLTEQVDFERFLQFCAFRHWHEVRLAAGRRGISILGDLPIYVAHDSAEVWARPQLFELDGEGRPVAVAGVPPDYYSADGQLWGNPLYRWPALAADGYSWWVDRLRANLALSDLVRLDHFRAFADYWRVPGDAATARDGTWSDGPGKALFDAFRGELGEPLPLIAEDLGDLSDKVHALRREVGLPCMKVLQFGFDPADSEHAPFRLSPDTLYYTGTHDNDTSASWFEGLEGDVRSRVLAYLGDPAGDIHRHLVRLALTSVAHWAVVPMQDVLGLGGDARMNTPGIATGNWTWRLRRLPPESDATWLRRLITAAGRLGTDGRDS